MAGCSDSNNLSRIKSTFDGATTTNYDYDFNGNVLTGAGRTITWNKDNRLDTVNASTGSAVMSFDYTGIRVKKSGSTGTTYFPFSGYEVQGSQVTKYIKLGNEIIASKKGSTRFFYHNDHLGGVNIISDINAGQAQLIEYDSWGKVSRSEIVTNPEPTHRFTGQEFDSESGIHYYGGRYYDQNIGRFISPDPFVQDPDDPQNLNRYSYGLNNPQNYIDPSGYFFDDYDADIFMSISPGLSYSSNLWSNIRSTYSQISTFSSSTIFSTFSSSTISTFGITFGNFAQTTLDAGGWLPGLPGTIATLGSAAVSVAQGDYLGGAIGTVAAAAPLVGIPSKVAKTAIEATQIARGFTSLTHAAKFGIQPYNILRTGIREAGVTGLQKHHLIEQRFAKLFKDQKGLTKLSIALTPAEHQSFTNAWRKAIEYGEKGTGTADKDLVIQKAREYMRIIQTHLVA
jgi:RHS repeat-associated protein